MLASMYRLYIAILILLWMSFTFFNAVSKNLATFSKDLSDKACPYIVILFCVLLTGHELRSLLNNLDPSDTHKCPSEGKEAFHGGDWSITLTVNRPGM
jgi:hypothetical protein